MARTAQQQRVVSIHLTATVLQTTAAALIWGVSTLYMLDAGLDIFQVMLVNTAFSLSQAFFEVPTGVLADTIGRRASYLISIALLILSTLLYLAAGPYGFGMAGFAAASALLAFAWTFQTGAVDAWFVDALDHTGWEGSKDRAFALTGIASEVSLIVGTLTGGLLGQADLAWPFIGRALVLGVTFAFVALAVRDLGFERRPLTVGTFGSEVRRAAREGIRHGWHNRVVRPLLFENLTAGAVYMFGFYSLQPYLLDLIGKRLVWAAAAVTAAGSLAGIAGAALVGRVMRGRGERRRPGRVLIAVGGIASAGIVGAGALGVVSGSGGGMWPVLGLTAAWLVICLGNGLLGPIRRSFLNEHIPSAHRATVLSVDALFEEMGAAGGQPVLGWLSKTVSIPVAWLVGGVVMAAGLPLFGVADRAAARAEERPA